jgi:uncharacterized protein YukE
VAATDPAPPIFDPEFEKLNFDQIAALIEELTPERFYRQAQWFDSAAARLEQVLDDFRRVSREVGEYWGGEVSAAFDHVAYELAGAITNTLQPLQAPGYGQALRQAGDALALAQQRLRDLRTQQTQQAPAPPPAPGAPTPEQIGHDSALQILRDLGTAYHDIGIGLAPMPEPAGGGSAAGAGPGTGENIGAGNGVAETGPRWADSGLAGYPGGAGVFWTRGTGSPGADTSGSRWSAPAGGAHPAGYAPGDDPDGTADEDGLFGQERPVPAGADGTGPFALLLAGSMGPAVLGRGSAGRPRPKKDKTAKTTKKAPVEQDEGTISVAGADTAERPVTVSDTHRSVTPVVTQPVTVSHATAASTPVTVAGAAGPPATAASGSSTVAGAAGPPVTASAQAAASAPPPRTAPPPDFQASANAAASAAGAAERAIRTGGGFGGGAPGGAGFGSPVPPPVHPLPPAGLSATAEAGFPMRGGAPGGEPGVAAGAAGANAAQPMSPMMLGGLGTQGQETKEKDRMSEVLIGPGPDVWNRGDEMPSVLGRPEPRPDPPAAEPRGAESKLRDLRQLGEEVLGRIKGRSNTDD